MGKPPSLLDLCIQTAIDNIQYLGDVGETDSELLKVILAHCSEEQLMFIEDSTEGRDLSPVTDSLWMNIYERKFGEENVILVKRRMKQKGVIFKWRLLYQAKLEEQEKQQQKMLEKSLDRLKQRYAKADQEKQSKQIQICTKVPPTKRNRNYGGYGSSSDLSNVKGRLMKKAKMEFAASRDARRNVTMMNRNSAQSFVPLGKMSNMSTASAKSSASVIQRPVINSNMSTASTKSNLLVTSRNGMNSNVSTAPKHVMNSNSSTTSVKSFSTLTSNCGGKLNFSSSGSSIRPKGSMLQPKRKAM
uniref:Elongin-A n=1 Tax=Araucaria cunninghamii TaxID=56994 RepID=A0A0D6R7K5_ARACU